MPKTPLHECAHEWWKTWVEIMPREIPNERYDEVVDAIVRRTSTCEDLEGFKAINFIMLQSYVLMATQIGHARAADSLIITALLLGAHLSKEGHL